MKYIVEYGTIDYPEDNRYYAVSVRNKIEYVISALNDINIDVDVISYARSLNKKGFYPKRKEQINKATTLLNVPAICFGTPFGKKIQTIFMLIWLFFYMLKNVEKNEQIIVYHSLVVAPILILAQKIKKFQIILEVEEVYCNLIQASKVSKYLENKIISAADKYIFVSDEINKMINKNKKYCILNGRYIVVDKICEPFDDGNIHIVYAGSIKYELVAFSAIEIARFLPSNYRFHVIGYGEDEDIKILKNKIEEINQTAPCIVTYDGMLSGVEYDSFLQKCNIGISPQNPDETFANSCFPSKIASYLSNGLRVVSSQSKAIKESELGQLIYFSKSGSMEDYAKTIMSVNIDNDYDSREKLKSMDIEFKKALNKMISSGEC